MKITVNKVTRGFVVDTQTKDGSTLLGKTSVYQDTKEEFKRMIEEIGRELNEGKKIEVIYK